MFKVKKKLSREKIKELPESENLLFLKMGFPACPKCKHALSARLRINGIGYLLCPCCGETVRDSEEE